MALWDRQPGETVKWFGRFNLYRLMGTNRTVRKAYVQEMLGDTPVIPGTKVETSHFKVPPNWYSAKDRYNWIARAEAWDTEQQRIADKEEHEERKAFRKQFMQRERAVINTLLEKAEQMLKFPVAKVSTVTENNQGVPVQITTIEPADWRMRDIPYLIDVVTKIGRLSAGEATEYVRNDGVTLEDVINALPDELGEQVRESLGRTLPESGDRALPAE